MNRRRRLIAALGWTATIGLTPSRAQKPAPPPPLGEVKALGQDRYQVGRIMVDKRSGSFIVPGRVHAPGKPLEYLATSPRGMKAYESLFELDATGSEFNLSCILIGLERDPNQVSYMNFRQTAKLIGPRVKIAIAWTEDGKRRQVSAAEALLNPEAGVKPESVEWVYTGSPAPDSRGLFAADVTGTLIGFIHDANCIIEAVTTVGVGAYGSVRGHAMLPPVGSAIELIVEAATASK